MDLILTFFDIGLLGGKVLHDLLFADAFLLLVGLLGGLRLGRLPFLEHGEVVPESVEEASERLALALDVGLCVLDWRPDKWLRGALTWL